jgi:hypothetical protein
VVYHVDEPDDVRRALDALVAWRSRTSADDAVHELDYRPGEVFVEWLARHGGYPGHVQPRAVPYYLLLVGPPDRIPFEFQYHADVEYAVGRLDLDSPADYETYARSVIDQEGEEPPARSPTAAVFGTHHPWDARATGLSSTELITPLIEGHDGQPPAVRAGGLEPVGLVAEAATQAALLEILAGSGSRVGRPSLLFTATHGLGALAPSEPERQRSLHGALVCQDWAGPGPIDVDREIVAAAHVTDANVAGLIAFFFACYGAGTPALDEFPGATIAPPGTRAVIAEQPFVAALPKALLGHPNGAALAVVAHIERTFSTSILGPGGTQIDLFEDAISQIAAGRPVGHAMTGFNQRYAILSTNLATELRELGYGKVISPAKLAALWLERHDAQNLVVLGDPAVRLPTR